MKLCNKESYECDLEEFLMRIKNFILSKKEIISFCGIEDKNDLFEDSLILK